MANFGKVKDEILVIGSLCIGSGLIGATFFPRPFQDPCMPKMPKSPEAQARFQTVQVLFDQLYNDAETIFKGLQDYKSNPREYDIAAYRKANPKLVEDFLKNVENLDKLAPSVSKIILDIDSPYSARALYFPDAVGYFKSLARCLKNDSGLEIGAYGVFYQDCVHGQRIMKDQFN